MPANALMERIRDLFALAFSAGKKASTEAEGGRQHQQEEPPAPGAQVELYTSCSPESRVYSPPVLAISSHVGNSAAAGAQATETAGEIEHNLLVQAAQRVAEQAAEQALVAEAAAAARTTATSNRAIQHSQNHAVATCSPATSAPSHAGYGHRVELRGARETRSRIGAAAAPIVSDARGAQTGAKGRRRRCLTTAANKEDALALALQRLRDYAGKILVLEERCQELQRQVEEVSSSRSDYLKGAEPLRMVQGMAQLVGENALEMMRCKQALTQTVTGQESLLENLEHTLTVTQQQLSAAHERQKIAHAHWQSVQLQVVELRHELASKLQATAREYQHQLAAARAAYEEALEADTRSRQQAFSSEIRGYIRRCGELKDEVHHWQRLCEALEAQLTVSRKRE